MGKGRKEKEREGLRRKGKKRGGRRGRVFASVLSSTRLGLCILH